MNSTLKDTALVLLIIQVALFSLGVTQIVSGNPDTLWFGVFNVVLNTVGGSLNIRTLFS